MEVMTCNAVAVVAEGSDEAQKMHEDLVKVIYDAIEGHFRGMGRATNEDGEFVDNITNIANNAASECYVYRAD